MIKKWIEQNIFGLPRLSKKEKLFKQIEIDVFTNHNPYTIYVTMPDELIKKDDIKFKHGYSYLLMRCDDKVTLEKKINKKEFNLEHEKQILRRILKLEEEDVYKELKYRGI